MESLKQYNYSIFDIIAPEKVTPVLFCYVCPLIIPKQWEDQLRCLMVVILFVLKDFYLFKDRYLGDWLQRKTDLDPLVGLQNLILNSQSQVKVNLLIMII